MATAGFIRRALDEMGPAGVNSFNLRTGNVVLLPEDIVDAAGALIPLVRTEADAGELEIRRAL